MVQTYKVTVIVTTFNLEKYIGQCLEELYNQSFQNFEILIVDDKSTDATTNIIEGWKYKWNGRIKTIYLDENLGMPALTRNVALASNLINGEYVLFLDGDDSIEESMLEKMCRRADMDNSDIVICGYDRIDVRKDKVISKEMLQKPYSLFLPSDKYLLPYINTAPWNKLWRKDIIENLRFPTFKVGEEVSFNFNAYVKSNKISFIDEVLIHYIIREDSVISNTDEKTIWKFADEMKKMVDSSSEYYKEISEVICFLHIGLSMPLRAVNNNDINFNEFMKKIYNYFSTYKFFKGNKLLKLGELAKFGNKGLLIYIALLAYKIRVFTFAMKFYKILGLQIKF